jgi:hypothetical protein
MFQLQIGEKHPTFMATTNDENHQATFLFNNLGGAFRVV